MSANCQLVVFTNKAYNAIIRESFDKDPVETGGIILGHVLDNGVWIVMEVLPPGINSVFQYAYFEYDEDFVNYLAQSVANQYKMPLDLLGLWHRHPGSMDFFSNTDDGTNTTFARQSRKGAISGLVNIDPQFRITMYHLDQPTQMNVGRPNYSIVDIEVGDDIIPEEFFELRYYNNEGENLHPTIAARQQSRSIYRDMHSQPSEECNNRSGNYNNPENNTPKFINDFFRFWKTSNKRWLVVVAAIAIIIGSVFSIRSFRDFIVGSKSSIENIDSILTKKQKNFLYFKESIELNAKKKRDTITTLRFNVPIFKWSSANEKVATVENGIVSGHNNGETPIILSILGKEVARCKIIVKNITIGKDNVNSIEEANDSTNISQSNNSEVKQGDK